MKFIQNIQNAVKNTASKVKLTTIKNSPEILLGVGIVGLVSSGVMAAQKGDVASAIKAKYDAMDDDARMLAENSDDVFAKTGERFTDVDCKQAIFGNKINRTREYIKAYALPIVVATASIACLLASHKIQKERYAQLAGAYGTLQQAFKIYRKRVEDRYGADVERDIRLGVERDKKGNVTNADDIADSIAKNTVKTSPYARFFDAASPYWRKDGNANFIYLSGQQNFWNDKLKRDGIVFLNDVYKQLGLPISADGQIVGWRYDPKNPNIDNYIDFGILELSEQRIRDVVNGYENVILLDFNVDGDVWSTL